MSRLKAKIEPCEPTSTQAMPRSATSMPSVAAIGSAPKPTMATALMPPKQRQATSVTAAALAGSQPSEIKSANSADENPTIEPIERSTTPESSAKPEKAPTISGTMTKVPMIETLPKLQELRPDPEPAHRDHRDEGEGDRGDRAGERRAPLLAEATPGGGQGGHVAHGVPLRARKPSMATAMTRMKPWKIDWVSELSPKNTSEVGMVERNPTREQQHPEIAAPARQRDAGEDHPGDDVELQRIGRARVERPGGRREQHRGEADEAAGGDEGREPRRLAARCRAPWPPPGCRPPRSSAARSWSAAAGSRPPAPAPASARRWRAGRGRWRGRTGRSRC